MSSRNYEKRILVTGGAGFMGSHMVIYLVNKYPNYFIVNLDKLCYNASLKNLQCIKGKRNYKFIKADVCDEARMKEVFTQESISHVIHFAALSHVDYSFVCALDFNHTNIYGTQVLAKTASELSVKRFLLISTDEVYGGGTVKPSKEIDPMNPSSPYACSKASSEIMAHCYLQCYQLPLITIRATNVYGPHKFPENVIPKFICLLLRNRKCCIHGNGEAIRHYLYVSDATKAYDMILHEGKDGQKYNVGCDFKMSVLEVAQYLVAELKGQEADPSKHFDFTQDRLVNDHHYQMDSSKMHKLGWKPEVSWKQGIEITVAWYKDNFGNWDNTEAVLNPFPHSNILEHISINQTPSEA